MLNANVRCGACDRYHNLVIIDYRLSLALNLLGIPVPRTAVHTAVIVKYFLSTYIRYIQ